MRSTTKAALPLLVLGGTVAPTVAALDSLLDHSVCNTRQPDQGGMP
jgi:hypothetical protein